MGHSLGITQDDVDRFREIMNSIKSFVERSLKVGNKRDMKMNTDAVATLVSKIRHNIFKELTEFEKGYNKAKSQEKRVIKLRGIKS